MSQRSSLKQKPFPETPDQAQARIRAGEVRLPVLAAAVAGPLINKLASEPDTGRLRHRIVNSLGDRAVRRRSHERELQPSQADRISKLYEKTGYWHGTGRFQYREDGSVKDVLNETLKKGLVPKYDEFDPIAGPMTSISLARSRMYSRSYADMHGKGENEPERYGNSLFWATYFMGSIAANGVLEMAIETKPFTREGRAKLEELKANLGTSPMHWWDKVHSSTWGIIAPFKFGSDIDRNYPVLIGVAKDTVEPTNTANTIGIHEIRTGKPIPVSSFTHLEVPEAKITETQSVLSELGLEVSVIAIEEGDAYSANKPFLELVKPVPV